MHDDYGTGKILEDEGEAITISATSRGTTGQLKVQRASKFRGGADNRSIAKLKMGNLITFSNSPELWVKMSNGGTSMFAAVLALAGAKLATDERHKYIVTWLSAALDQHMAGIGCAGFDHVKDFPWKRESFEEDKDFLRKLLDSLGTKIGWNVLNFEPNEEFLNQYSLEYKKLLKAITLASIDWDKEASGIDDLIPDKFEQCSTHGCFLHVEGCVICHVDE